MKGIRAGVRMPLELPAELRWKNERGVTRRVRGKTGSISGNGLLVTVPVRPPRKTPIFFTITLPQEVTKVPLDLECRGRVVRLYQHGQSSAVGAIIDDYKLRTAH